MKIERDSKPLYHEHYCNTKAMILILSGLPIDVLEEAATELHFDYEVFLIEYRGAYLVDAHIGLLEMLRQWPTPWPHAEESSLGGLTLAQFFLAWAWSQNWTAKHYLDGEAVSYGCTPADAYDCGLVAAISAAKSLSHAKLLMALGDENVAQDSA